MDNRGIPPDDPYHRQQQQQQQHPDFLPSSNQQQQQLSPEEQRVLRECSRESFYRRSLPLSMLGAAAVVAAARRGVVTPHPNYGIAPKVMTDE